VKSVNYEKSAVVLTSSKGETLTCSHCVVTVSLPMLKSEWIQFVPPLPPAKIRAIKSIVVDNALKVAISFSQRFWPSNVHGIICANTLIPEIWFDGPPDRVGPLTEHSRQPKRPFHGTSTYVIAGYATSEFANRITTLGKDKVVAEFLEMLDKMFCFNRAFKLCNSPEAKPETNIAKPATSFYVKSILQSWADEPWIRGGYSSPTLGTNEQTRIDLASPVNGRLFFAGEATNPSSYMTMHGSMETGQFAAEAITAISAKQASSKL